MKTVFKGKSSTGIETYTLENDNGMRADIITYGARIQRLFVPDKNGNPIDVVAGFDDPEQFRNDRGTYFNATIGRVGNRIEKGRFVLNGKEYKLYTNDGENHLHGGKFGFDKKLWTACAEKDGTLKLTYFSQDGEEGYPGNMTVCVTYALTNDNSLNISYEAQSDKDTLCSLTNHAYFNLDGEFESVLDHEIFIDADKLTDVDDGLIPHGGIMNVKGTAFDFTTAKPLGRDIEADERLLKIARGGYDFNYILNRHDTEHGTEKPVASAYSKKSGIEMSVYTDRPCMQFYTGNFLDGFCGKKPYPYQSAFCMETQGFPNACNVPSFESMTLSAGEKYVTSTSYVFKIRE